MKKIIYILIILIILSACHNSYKPKAANDELKIVMTSDLHYLDNTLKTHEVFEPYQRKSDGKLSIYVEELVDTFIEEMLELKPDIVAISGDLTFNGEYLSHKTLVKKLNKLEKNSISVLVIPGNHDILNVRAIDYSKEGLDYAKATTVKEYAKIYQDLGLNEAISKDTDSLSYLYKASDSLYLVMLDSNTYEKNTGFAPSNDGEIKKSTLNWLNNELANIKDNSNIILFSHHPILDLGGSSEQSIINRNELLELIHKYNIKLGISGHIHAQNYLNDDDFYNFGLSSLVVYDHQYTILDYRPNNEFDLVTKNMDVENYAKNHNLKNEFFNNFDENAKEYFKIYSTTRLINNYIGDDIDPIISDEIYNLKGILNTYEFKGEAFKFKEILESNKYYEDILKYKSSYAKGLFNINTHFYNDATKLNIKLQ